MHTITTFEQSDAKTGEEAGFDISQSHRDYRILLTCRGGSLRTDTITGIA